MGEALLEARELVAGYRGPVAGPVSFEVQPGETVGLVGPNGSGKSTLFKAIVGTARILGGSVRRRAGLRLAVQSQELVRLPEMPVTGRELLRLTGAHLRPVPEPVAPLLGSRLDRLSGGQYQLVHVWACLGSPADLVLLDEPTNNMDERVTDELARVLEGATGGGRGVLLISHERAFLERTCTRLVELGR